MFEPIPNFGNSLPNRLVSLKTMRQLAMDRAIPAMPEGTNPFLNHMLANPADVAEIEALEPQQPRPFIFGLIREHHGKVSPKPPRLRHQPPPYFFLHGRRVKR